MTTRVKYQLWDKQRNRLLDESFDLNWLKRVQKSFPGTEIKLVEYDDHGYGGAGIT